MSRKYILSHNLGTTGNKAVLYDENGQIERSWLSSYRSHYFPGNKVEQVPDDWWKAVCESTYRVMRGINEKSVQVVTFSGQMMGCLCLDQHGEPVGNSIIWADSRASREAKALAAQIDERLFYQITGHRISSSYSAEKILWIMNHEPERFRMTSKIVQAKDYIVYRLTGQLYTDFSDASGTHLLNIEEKRWSRTILSILGLSEDLLPDIVPSTQSVGKITFEAAEQTGLLPGTPVVIGAGDGICAAIAAGCTDVDDAYLYFGSSAWIGLCKEKPYLDEQFRIFNWAGIDEKRYSPCGTMQAAGASLDWLKDEMAQDEISQAMVQKIAPQTLIEQELLQSSPSANGLIFLPYLLGERSPYWNPNAKGAFIGLQKNHTKADIYRAGYEGVALNLKIIWKSLLPIINAKELVLTGGQANSIFNRQLIADVLDIPVLTTNHIGDSKNFGAAIIGGIGIGMYDDVSVAKKLTVKESRLEPNPENVRIYEKLIGIFEDAYKSLESIFLKLDQYNAWRNSREIQ
ncbi:xylulokinase [Parasphaerochaeta coccoides]|uniref:Carbohydrate kinase, FGGY n=1 Tax=Parasphaerochaeta coccoides (strain ATCC BAA-1237 / DSM 17374 / SPN1) TaxID=760011 RepID=F4GIA1_PARC1|nr:FGGY-family carbohydrate kinase [Parasphaerochaeta coccoides]AEC01260.1 Carbohydrate kinase, FGGY [Parasphaerochaeta coccoides DSM 17374]